MYPTENYKADAVPQETRALQYLAGNLNNIYQRLSKISARLNEANTRAFGPCPTAGEKSSQQQVNSGLISELSYGVNAIDEMISTIESQINQVEKII